MRVSRLVATLPLSELEDGKCGFLFPQRRLSWEQAEDQIMSKHGLPASYATL